MRRTTYVAPVLALLIALVVALALFAGAADGEVVGFVLAAGLVFALARGANGPSAAPPLDGERLAVGQGAQVSNVRSLVSRPRRSRPGAGDPEARSRAAGRPAVWDADVPTVTALVGYATVSASERGFDGQAFKEQADAIARECGRRGVTLLELVREREPSSGKGLECPGLGYALQRISTGEAQGLVVADLQRLTRSAAELGAILVWFTRSRARLVAVAQGLDTAEREGRIAVRTLVDVSGWERERLSQRTRKGLEAARRKGRAGARPAVADDFDLSERIARMRAQGMTLQAIADRLNEEGVPTIRSGAKWRPSSLQAAAGYRRQRRTPFPTPPAENEPVPDRGNRV